MDDTRLGTSGLKVSRICLGCMSFGDASQRGWTLDQDAAEPIFRKALELGITFWDTANVYVYGHGSSEQIVGATKERHLTDAAAALDIELTVDELVRAWRSRTPFGSPRTSEPTTAPTG